MAAYQTLARGVWSAKQIHTYWRAGLYQLPERLHPEMALFWQTAEKQGHYNGRLARLDNFILKNTCMHLNLCTTDYKTLLFCNRFTARIVDDWQPQALARALGLSAIIKTRDHQIVLLKRSARVGEYPECYDLFGGHIDAALRNDDQAPFTGIQQELEEEAALKKSSYDLKCIGLIEALDHQKPEMLFIADCGFTTAKILEQARLAQDAHEYQQILSLEDNPVRIQQFLDEEKEISPSAFGCLSEYINYQKQNL